MVLKHALGVTIALEVLLLKSKGGDIGAKSISFFDGALTLLFPFLIVYDIDFLKDISIIKASHDQYIFF